jgi:hypothetical protein
MSNYDREVEIFYDIYTDAWESNWGHSEISEEEFQFMAMGLKDILDPNLVFIAEYQGVPVALALSVPDINQVVKKMNGRLFPFGWWHWLTGRKKVDVVRIFILGVKREYQHLPVGAPMYIQTWLQAIEHYPKVRGGEASLIVEDNYRMRGALEKLGARIYKTYRIYGRSLDGSPVTADINNPDSDQA